MKKIILAFLGISLIGIDQAIKWWMIKYHSSLVYMNKGILFGFIENKLVSIILLVLGIIALIWISLDKQKKRWQSFALVLIFAGATSNIIDRISHGAVIDYITIKGLNNFNLADVFIIGGVVLYTVLILRKK